MSDASDPQPQSIAALRDELLAQFKIVPNAWSPGNGEFGFVAHLEGAPPVGSYVRLQTREGDTLLGQAQSCEVTQSVLANVSAGAHGAVTAAVPIPVRHVQGHGIVLGRVSDAGLEVLDPPPAFSDARLLPAEPGDVAAHRADETAGSSTLDIGVLALVPEVGGDVRAKGYNRHTLLCGQSGSGKTYSMGVLLEQLLLATDLRMVVLDPNSDYVGLREVRTREAMNRFRSAALSEAEYDDLVARYRACVDGVRIARASGGDLPLKIHFSDLESDEQAAALALDPMRDLAEFNLLREVVTGLGTTYSVRDVHQATRLVGTDAAVRLSQRIENLGVADWSLWAEADEPSLALGLVAVGRLQRRMAREPLMVVIDEAHNLCPPASDDLLVTVLTERIAWMAGEGRKYGTYLLLATQRPQKLHVNVASQFENLVLMRVNSQPDRAHLAELFSRTPAAMVEAARDFGLGEALVTGPVSPTPIRVKIGGRLSVEGGADLPTSWADPKS